MRYARTLRLRLLLSLSPPSHPLHGSVPAVLTQPPVNAGVNRLTDLLSSPPLVRPYRLSRVPLSRVRVAASTASRGGMLSDC